MNKLLAGMALFAVTLAATAAEQSAAQPSGQAVARIRMPETTAVTDQMLRQPSPGDWLMWRGNLSGWNFSPLKQINTGNVRKLKLAWSRGLRPGSQEGMPLVHDGVMYMPNPADVIQALDAATGEQYWEYRRQWAEDVAKIFPTPTMNRSIALYGDKVIAASADDNIYALDARSGTLAWQTAFVDYRQHPAQKSAGPLVIPGGKVIAGRGCEPKGGPDACLITAHDAATGKELWRTYTIPRPGEPGDDSWGGVPFQQRRHVGTWMPPSYDPELNLIYIGTSVTSPAPKFLLGGNDKRHLYHNSTLALDADTGKIVWYYQHLIDHWDMDHTLERILVDTIVAPDPRSVSWINPRLRPGEQRQVITGIPGKTGIVYTLDRKTGEFLWATPTVRQNLVRDIDGATGEIIANPDTLMAKQGDSVNICPSPMGGKNWPGSGFDPVTKLMFEPLQNTCADITAVIDKPSLSSLYGVRVVPTVADPQGLIGAVHAVSVETGRTAWKHQRRSPTLSLVATAGGVVFGGDFNGHAFALDARTGKVLWEVNLGSPLSGYPVSYEVKGRQYVAFSTGQQVPQGAILQLAPELQPAFNSALYVFELP